MESVQPSFSTFQSLLASSRDSLTGRISPQRISFNSSSQDHRAQSEPMWKWVYLKFFLEWAEVLITQFRVLLHPGFISNPPAISLALLRWRTWVIKPFFCSSCRNTFSGYLAISESVFDSARDKKHESFSLLPPSVMLWVCHSLLPAITAAATYRLTQMKDSEGFGVLWHMCSFMRRSQCGAPLGWGNDPDAKLLGLVTQWDTCPAAPVQPPCKIHKDSGW